MSIPIVAPATAEITPELLTVKETAAHLRIPLPTVYYLIQRGQLPAIQIGGRWRIKRSLLERDILKNDKAQPQVVALHDDIATMSRELNPKVTHCARIVTASIEHAINTIFHQGCDLLILGDCQELHVLSPEEYSPIFEELSDKCPVFVSLAPHIDPAELMQVAKRCLTYLPHPMDPENLRAAIAQILS